MEYKQNYSKKPLMSLHLHFACCSIDHSALVPYQKTGQHSPCSQKSLFPTSRELSTLLPTVSKVLERCILNIIKTHLCNRVSKHQSGFLKGKSCTTNLIETLDCIGRLLDRGSQIEVIYLAMSKAFDKVNHAQLLFKLHIFGFGGKLFNLDLNNVRSWSTKSRCQSITRKTKPLNTAYDMNEAMLEKTSHERDLGVWVSTDPIWNQSNARCMQTSCKGLLNDLRVIYKVPM